MKFSLKQIALGTAIAMSSLSALAADTIKIGSVLSVTGPAAFLGDPELKTLQLYVEELNKKVACWAVNSNSCTTTMAAMPTKPTASPSV